MPIDVLDEGDSLVVVVVKQEVIEIGVYQMEVLIVIVQDTLGFEVQVIDYGLVLVQINPSTNFEMVDDLFVRMAKDQDVALVVGSEKHFYDLENVEVTTIELADVDSLVEVSVET